MPVKIVDNDPEQARRFARAGAAASRRRSIRWRAICCATPPTPRTRCRNVTCARCKHFRHAIAGRRSSRGCSRSCAMSATPNMPDAPRAPMTGAIEDCAESAEADAAAGTRRRTRRRPRSSAQHDAGTIRRLIATLAEPFRETFVLREIENLSYREIADVADGARRHRDVAPRARPRHAAIGMACGTGATEMTCDEAEILLHALIDGELDAGHAREVEAHIATARAAPRCSQDYREMSKTDCRGRRALHRTAGAAPPHRGFAAAAAGRAEPARGADAVLRWARRCRRSPRPVLSRSCCAMTTWRASSPKMRLGASALAAGRPSHRRDLHRPAHGEAVVQRQARCRAAGDRPHRAGFYADRRPARLRRCPRRSAPWSIAGAST